MDMIFLPVQVRTYSGYRADERPVAFEYQDVWHQVTEILDRWYEGGVESNRPIVSYFKVKTDQQQIFLLQYFVAAEKWGACRL